MKRKLKNMDLWLLVLVFVYSILGAIMIYSASSILTFLKQDLSNNHYFVRQLAILVISFGFNLIVIRIPTSKYRYISTLLYIGILASLFGLYIGGTVTNGTLGWYNLGKFNFQPAEFAKSVIIVFMACSYNKLINQNEKKYIKYLIPVFLCGLLALIVLLQPDLGSAIILGGIVVGIFLALPIEKSIKRKCYKVFGIIILIGLFGMLIFKDKIFNEYQLKRFQFQSPCSRYTESTGYQVCNGFIAIKNGGLFGLGFGNSTQKYLYLPEAHTDFIFPIVVEELGLITGSIIILGYLFMLYRLLIIAKKASNIRNSILAYGTFFYLLLHILINLMGVLALIPLTGVPLPFLSYGGSFALNAITMLTICQKVSIESKENQFKEKISNL